MAALRYRRFLKLCEEWPVDETKRGRDLGAYLRQRVAQAFREGENTQIAEPEACDQMYESLARLHSNYYKHKYPRPRDTSFSGLSVEEYKLILSTGMKASLPSLLGSLSPTRHFGRVSRDE
ncbi:ubiquinol-cytochrome c reductase complex assembly factor 2 isoform X2 [Arvicanthis niloticus]|uniref:ubiquinol-cytochrome c reductase complex assembly factor 2 isoform X2 n=1 Tax=Arvicanthis niloticus TaxID=61156 RepID=UPI00148644A8|nr:ubiquinol-cytochrome-c reductase complex assembly factor 2 isoform X2 [Arvicanthis niloticus]